MNSIYPMPINRNTYVSQIESRNSRLEENHLGIHSEIIKRRMRLNSGDEVFVNVVGENDSKSLFKRKVYKLFPITERDDSRLVNLSLDGGVVVSSKAPRELSKGNEIIINGTIKRLIKNKSPEKMALARFLEKE